MTYIPNTYTSKAYMNAVYLIYYEQMQPGMAMIVHGEEVFTSWEPQEWVPCTLFPCSLACLGEDGLEMPSIRKRN
jgi:hypothetical protein